MVRVVPILTRPQLLTIKNRWLRSPHGILKESLALLISILMMCGVYLCSVTALQQSRNALSLLHTQLNPSLSLAFALVGVCALLFSSATIIAYNALFTGRDLDLAHCAPLKTSQFLYSKLAEVSLALGWMVCTFALPSLMACGIFFKASLLYYVGMPILLVALLALTIISAMITTLCVAIILPTSRAQTVLALLTITGGITALVYSEGTSSINFTNILHATPASEAALSSWRWLPPVSVARSLAKLMVNSPLPAVWSLVYLASCAGVLWLLLQKLFITRYHQACAKAQAHHAPRSINSRAAQQFARLCFPIARSTTRAIATKEFKIFSRDITHTVQICLLLCICFIYLRAFRNLPPPPGLQMAVQAAWQLLLLVGNIILSSFVIVSICSRFVFPSVSLEGAAFWIAQSTPLSYGELLRGKCKSWLLPLSVIASVIFGSGAMALNADARLVLVSSISGMLITYGIVGLAVGLGAVFARFDCEHATQVSMSLGGMIFITASFALVLCNTLPLTWIFGGQLLFPPLRPSFHATFVYLYLPLLVLLAINVTVTALAIRQGRRALRKL